jgi:hypothetical protein
MSSILGIILSFVKNMVWIGFSLIESVMLTLSFNYLAPIVNAQYLKTWKLPFEHVEFWHVFAFFIVIHYIGQFIQTVTPKIFYYNSTDESRK